MPQYATPSRKSTGMVTIDQLSLLFLDRFHVICMSTPAKQTRNNIERFFAPHKLNRVYFIPVGVTERCNRSKYGSYCVYVSFYTHEEMCSAFNDKQNVPFKVSCNRTGTRTHMTLVNIQEFRSTMLYAGCKQSSFDAHETWFAYCASVQTSHQTKEFVVVPSLPPPVRDLETFPVLSSDRNPKPIAVSDDSHLTRISYEQELTGDIEVVDSSANSLFSEESCSIEAQSDTTSVQMEESLPATPPSYESISDTTNYNAIDEFLSAPSVNLDGPHPTESAFSLSDMNRVMPLPLAREHQKPFSVFSNQLKYNFTYSSSIMPGSDQQKPRTVAPAPPTLPVLPLNEHKGTDISIVNHPLNPVQSKPFFQILTEMQLHACVQVFAKEEICDWETFKLLSGDDIAALNFPMGPRVKLLKLQKEHAHVHCI